ncbi:MAG TPA: 6-carboxytetrahydropterin synthase [Longimicrobiales bacterium]|nr:6-carboxytetrahydropterin synthase [Longimicrobiales bacterium]
MPRVRLTRRVHFSAAHRLGREDWDAERNLDTFGDCARTNWHGHNYELDVTVGGEVDPRLGFVMDLKRLKALAEERVADELDHRNLNVDVPWLQGINPTTENLVVAIWDRLKEALPDGVSLERLVLWETPRNYVEYTGEDGA